ncbi:MAG: VWA domain-containing protein [Elusimicrobia bacterium]|nr:VWA domain-containing protein [Elusimicrobiota bacterium]
MRFADPWALLLAPLAWAAAALVLTRGRDAALAYPAGELGRRLPPSLRARLSRLAPPLVSAAALSLAAVGLARPQSVKLLPGGDGRGIDIMLTVDTSLSMSSIDIKPNRITAAKEIAKAFVRGRVDDRIGLVTFGGAPLLACPLTVDRDALVERLDSLYPGMTKVDGTAIGDGLVSAANRLKDGTAKSKVIVLLTDGRSNTGIVDPITAAKTAAAIGAKIYAIGTAGRGTALMEVDDPKYGKQMVPTDDDLDDALLAQLASITGGKSYRAETRGELEKIFQEIDGLEKSEVKHPDIVAVADRHEPALAAAALILLAESALAATALLRWP